MKKRPLSLNAPAGTSTSRLPRFFNGFTRKGLGIAALSALLLAGSVQQASALQRIVSYRYNAALGDMTGHVISPIDLNDPNEGAAVAGNVKLPGYFNFGQGVHYALTDINGNATAGMYYKFPDFEDVRVVSIAYAGYGNSVMTIQGKENGTLTSHIIALKVDRYGNIMDQIDILSSGAAGAISYPQHSLVLGDQLYICGFQEQNTASPTNPSFYDGRQSFVMKINLNTHASMVRFYNTTMFGAGFIDYDAAMRFKTYYSALYILGSGNGPTSTSAGIQNSSKSWIASIDPVTLTIVQNNFYGFNADQNPSPTELKGTYAVDFVPDMAMDAYIIINNDLGKNRWFVTHTGLALGLQTPFAGFNAFTTVPSGHRMKANNIFAWVPSGTAPSARYSICGTVGSDVPLVNPGAYGTDIEFPSLGTVPFIEGFFLNPTGGASAVTNFRGAVLGNYPGNGPGLNFHESYWYNGNMGEWCNRSVAIQPGSWGYYPYVTGLSMTSHSRSSWAGPISHRFVGAWGDGEVSGCPGSQPMADIQPTYFNVVSQPLNVATTVGTTQEVGVNVDATQEGTIAEWECAPGFLYREAKPGSLTATEQAPGLYPNPATDHITIKLGQQVEANTQARVLMTDVTGRVVFTHEATLYNAEMNLNLPRLTPGLYQVAVSVAGAKPTIHKLVIQ
jgi:hypothetical protein